MQLWLSCGWGSSILTLILGLSSPRIIDRYITGQLGTAVYGSNPLQYIWTVLLLLLLLLLMSFIWRKFEGCSKCAKTGNNNNNNKKAVLSQRRPRDAPYMSLP